MNWTSDLNKHLPVWADTETDMASLFKKLNGHYFLR